MARKAASNPTPRPPGAPTDSSRAFPGGLVRFGSTLVNLCISPGRAASSQKGTGGGVELLNRSTAGGAWSLTSLARNQEAQQKQHIPRIRLKRTRA